MTIKELENRTGMARANIRFYENEGLLSPRRLDNGYRDYSEEDVQTLEKIKLLRQLQLDIETIRKVQRGALTLDQALFVQMTKLEGDRALLERAAEVCRELERSGVEYAALDPQPWLARLEPPPSRPVLPNPPPPTPQEEARDRLPQACWNPWQRWMARMLDTTLYATLFDVVWLVALRDRTLPMAGGIVGWVLALAALAFALAVEPLWLHYWGWTPGKWVFGLKLRNVDDEKLTLAQGVQRSCRVIWEGYGLNIPFYSWWRFWQCRKVSLEGRNCPWDGEEGHHYTKEPRRFSGLVFVAVSAACVVALVLALLYTAAPPHRGGLTVAEFSENYNYYSRQLMDRDSDLPTLDSGGRWVEREIPAGAVVINIFGDTTVWDGPEFTLEDGRVTAVKLHMRSQDSLVPRGSAREQLALLAMTGSLDGLNLINYNQRGWVEAYNSHTAWEDTAFTYRGLRVVQEVDYHGYEVGEGMLWQMDEDAPRSCERTLTISLAE